MIVPQSGVVALLMAILTVLCWGSWANVVKMVKGWRFELLYFDYALGILLASAVAALTLGSMGTCGLPFLEDLANAGWRNMAFGFLDLQPCKSTQDGGHEQDRNDCAVPFAGHLHLLL